MKKVIFDLNEEQAERLEELKKNLGIKTNAELFRELLMKKRVLPKLNTDILTLTQLGTGLIHKVRSLLNLLDAKIPDDFKNDFDSYLTNYEKVIKKYSEK